MTSLTSLPPTASRSRKRFLALLAVGLGLVALAAVYVVVQLSRDDAPNPETDFAAATCEDFDLAEFEEFSAGTVEFSDAHAGKYPDSEVHSMVCDYTSDSGMTLTFGATAGTEDDYDAVNALEEGRQLWYIGPDYTVEEFDNGDLSGYTRSLTDESEQRFELLVAVERLSIGFFLEAEPGGFEEAEALDLAEALATQVLERFEAYV